MQYITREHAGGRMEDTYRYLVSGHASGKRIVTPSRTHGGGGDLGYCMQLLHDAKKDESGAVLCAACREL